MYNIKQTKYLVLCALLSFVKGDLLCVKDNGNIICTPDDDFNTLQRGTVSDDEEAQSISLLGCKLTSIEFQSFEELPRLESLDLSVNIITSIQLGILDNLNNLQLLNLSSNLISDIPPGLFDHLNNLQILDLSRNQLTSLSSDIFHLTPFLHTLSLVYNSITELDVELFIKNPNIIYLDLSYNPNLVLPVGIFDNLKNLKTLKVAATNFALENILSQNTDLTKFDISNNNIAVIPNNYFYNFPKLNTLDLSGNVLTDLQEDVFSVLGTVKFLNLSRNKLNDISPLATLPNIVSLDVSNNQLQFIPIFNTNAMKYLDISGNLFTNFGSNIGAYIPRRLSVFKLHKNPWQCACLNQLLLVLKRRKISFKVEPYFNGKKPICAVMINKAGRCFREATHDQYFIKTYSEALKKYPK